MARNEMPNMGIIMPNMGISKTKRKTKLAPGLADTLFSATQQKVLGRIFGQPDRSFYATELIAAVGGGSGAVQRELARLEASGLVESSRIGNQKHYQANPSSPVFQELSSILQKLMATSSDPRRTGSALAEPAAPVYRVVPTSVDSVARTLRRLGVSKRRLASFCRQHGIRRLSFFGSVTRDDFRADSDVDVMVEFYPDKIPSLFGIVDLKAQLSALFGGRSVDVLTSPIISNPVRRRSIERDLQVAYAA